ncbi:MAG TPA: hypothetical protein VN884_01015 [Candidatus Sulfotelmatobacter sp.]|nr:hypothetical protein [Candidatus Sulfotelmatobacter sp.]
MLTATPTAPLIGTVETTVGASAVVKVQTKLAASPAPAGFFAPVVIVAVNSVPLARTAVGVKVAVEPANVTEPITGVAPGPVKVNVAALIVAGFMASLNVAESVVLTATLAAPLTGTVETTVGLGAATVVKVQTKLAASPAPVGSFAPVVIVAVNSVPLARTVVGVKVAVEPANVTVPITGMAPGPVKVNVDTLIVAGFMASLNVAETAVLTGTPVAPIVGTVETTVGAPVVKLHAKLLASAFSTVSVAPVVIVAVYVVLAAKATIGVNVAVVPEYVTAPITETPPGAVTVKVEVFIVAAFIILLKVAVMTCETGMPLEPFAGTVAITAGLEKETCSRPHPAVRPASRNTAIKSTGIVTFRISFSYSVRTGISLRLYQGSRGG